MRLLAIAFLTGILIVQQFTTLPALLWLLPGLLLAVVSSVFYYRFCYRFRSFSFVLTVLAGLAFGFSWALGYAHGMLNDRLLPEYEGVDILIEGMVSSLPESRQSDWKSRATQYSKPTLRFNLDVIKVLNPEPGDMSSFPKRLSLSWYRADKLVKAGQVWRLKVRLKRPYGMMNPGGFDYETWMFQKRIQAKGYVRKSNNNQLVIECSSCSLISRKVLQLRQVILDKLKLNAQSSEGGTVIRDLTAALILGYRGGLDASQWRVFQRTGTIHLMAISGLHIGLIAGVAYFLLGLVWRLSGRASLVLATPQVAASGALLAAIVYAMLAGFTIPTQRALIMLSVGLFHIIFRRTPYPASKTIALALILILLVDPLAVLAQGFWLSFFAVSLILFLIYQVTGKVSAEASNEDGVGQRSFYQRTFKGLLAFVRIQWVLSLAMVPLVLFFYHSSSLVSPLANFIAIPVMSFAVVPLMFVATLSLFVNNSLANGLFEFIDTVYRLLWQILEQFARWPYATLETALPSAWWLLPAYLAVMLLVLKKGTPMRWLAVIFVLPLVFPANAQLASGEAKLTVLDVGQGLSVVIRTRNHTLVYDAGPRYSQNFDTGRAVIVPYLRQQGRSVIDKFIISHADNDHIGGFQSVADLMTVKNVLTSVPNKITSRKITNKNAMPVSTCQAGQQWNYDGVRFSILSPVELPGALSSGHDENNMSCVLKVSTVFGSALLTGDIERETESYLYHSRPKQLKADVLIVPHHGSQTSSLQGFITAVSPKFAIFPVGYRNRYRLPNKKVVERYRQYSSARLIASNVAGALSFNFRAGLPLKAQSYRRSVQRYWHSRDSGFH